MERDEQQENNIEIVNEDITLDAAEGTKTEAEEVSLKPKRGAGRIVAYALSVILLIALVGGLSTYFIVSSNTRKEDARAQAEEDKRAEANRIAEANNQAFIDSLVGEWKDSDTDAYVIVITRKEIKTPGAKPMLYTVNAKTSDVFIDTSYRGNLEQGYDTQNCVFSEDKLHMRFIGKDESKPGTVTIINYDRLSTNPDAEPRNE